MLCAVSMKKQVTTQSNTPRFSAEEYTSCRAKGGVISGYYPGGQKGEE